MFQSVVEQKGWRSGRFGVGAGVSVLVHVGIVAAVFFISAGAAEVLPEKEPVVVFKPHTAPPKGNPNPAKAKPAAQPKPKPRPKKLTQPSVIPQMPPPEAEPAPTPEPEDDELPYVPGSHEDGVDEGGVPGAAITGLEQVLTHLEPTGTEAVDFGSGMQPPKLVSGASIQYTREALESRVRGMLVAKCVITREGAVETCKIIKGLPHMDVAVLSALETRRYSPVTWQGKPISVTYIFNIRLELPR